ncbi:glycosyltransferase family 39 protein [Rhizobium sp. ARZ01]|uniref:ArnT family glycosyltransferase n=1 Tax=Rhizobium sp. ARZ01 TaxID=2769313 RepID=UPI001780BA1C|nr:glycosyltransferase family 39 protein [Rhizobium sp. ARZ01]MBD9371589.1 glycosyltransferase family 39 protein [Rhizobium sp. ARZ01]
MVRFLRTAPNAVFVLLAAYFLLNFLVRLAMPDSLERDEAQQILLSQWLAAGYDTQPPFYNWVQYAIIKITGPSVFAISLLKNLVLFLAYLFYGLAARTALKSRDLAIIATLSLLTIPQIAFEAQRDLTHTVAVIFAASLFFYGLFRTLAAPGAASYLLTGVAIGIGMISKYNFALLPAAALVAVLLDREWRARLFDWRLLLTIAASIAIVAPHALWLLDHIGVASERTMEKLAEEGTGLSSQILGGFASLALAIVGFSALTFVVFAAVFRGQLLKALSQGSRWTRLIERMMLAFLLALALLIVFGGAAHIKDRWLTPLLLILPLYLCLKVEAAGGGDASQLKRFLPVPLLIMLAVPAILFGRVAMAGLTGDYQKLNVPYAAFAAHVREMDNVTPAAILTAEAHLAGNLRLQFADVPVLSDNYPGFAPKVGLSSESPLLVVWRNESGTETGIPPNLALYATRAQEVATADPIVRAIELPYIYGRAGDTYGFGYALIYPAAPPQSDAAKP